MPGPATRWGASLTVALQTLQGARLTKLFTGSYVTPTGVKPMRSAVARAAEKGIRVVPTLSMFALTVTPDEAYLAPIRAALRDFSEAGGRVLFGTDAGYLAERGTLEEFEQLAASGLTSPDILRTLTVEPAEFFQDHDAGTIEIGKRADFTVLDTRQDSPEPRDFAVIHAAIRGGRVIYDAGSRE